MNFYCIELTVTFSGVRGGGEDRTANITLYTENCLLPDTVYNTTVSACVNSMSGNTENNYANMTLRTDVPQYHNHSYRK